MSREVGDIALAGCISVISVTGTLLNSLALVYFVSARHQSRNSVYFKNIYSLIAVTDIIICSTLFPVIEAALRPARAGHLFNIPWFCDLWGALWTCAPIISIFLIAMLSVSRLLTIMFPTFQLKLRFSLSIPAGYIITLLVLFLILFYCRTLYVIYRPEWLSCYPAVFPAQTDPDTLVAPQDMERGLVVTFIFSCIPGLSIVPISITSVLSIIYLRRSAATAADLNSSAQHQNSATFTVVMVTTLYIVCNVPYSLMVFGSVIFNMFTSPDHHVTVHTYNVADVYNNHFLLNYGYFGIFYLSISLNSALNPLLYMWRMEDFRSWVKNKITRRNHWTRANRCNKIYPVLSPGTSSERSTKPRAEDGWE